MKNPFVSVLIPNYCHASYLNERIDSILAQTYTNFEIIIMDDCSTDNSRDIIESYRSNPHVSSIVYNTINSGSTFNQWDKGMSIAKGDLIWIAESDDSCKPELLERLVEQFEKYDNLAVAYVQSVLINAKGEVIQAPTEVGKPVVHDGIDFIRKHMLYGTAIINASQAVFNREKALKIDRCFRNYKSVGDWMFWVLMCETGNVAQIKEPLNLFRRYEGTVTEINAYNGISETHIKSIIDYIYQKGVISQYAYNLQRMITLSKIRKKQYANENIKNKLLHLWDQPHITIFFALKARVIEGIKRRIKNRL
jgi:glycosyltransferase involved in cell wall biosynthesis